MARRIGILVVTASVLALATGEARSGYPAMAGVAEALDGLWEAALERLEGSGDGGRCCGFFKAQAALSLGLRREAMTELRALSDSGGAFAGPALEVGVERLFREGKYRQVVEWAETTRADRFQDPAALDYFVGQSHYLLGEIELARSRLEGVDAGRYRAYAHHTLGLIHFAARAAKAMTELENALVGAADHPRSPVASALADRIRVTRGRLAYQVALGLAPDKPEVRSQLLELARTEFDRVRVDSASYAEALRGVGWAAFEADEATRALAAFELAAGLDSWERHQDLWAQGRVHQRVGSYGEAAVRYAEARTEALALAERVAGGMGLPVPTPGSMAWSARSSELRRVGRRVAALEEQEQEASAFLESLGVRALRAGAEIERLWEASRALAGELHAMTGSLRDYLDKIPASALFPRSRRARVEGVMARQDHLTLDMARLEAAFSVVESSGRWNTAMPGVRQRAIRLWSRLQRARAILSRAQLAFLQDLKHRVSDRERELARKIDGLRGVTLAMDKPVSLAREHLRVAERRIQVLGARVRELATRRKAAASQLALLEKWVGQGLEQSRREWSAAASARLRLQADRYALDETQALHLWQESAESEREVQP